MQTIASPASPIAKMDALSLRLKQRRDELDAISKQIDAEQKAIFLRHRAALREAFGKVAGAQAALTAEVTTHPELFVKPRTLTLHGIKFGFAKGKGRLVIEDETKSVALARKHLDAEKADLLIRVVESINKKAAAGLTAAELKKIGIQIEEAADEMVLSFVDSELDQLLERLLKQAQEDAQ